MISEGDQIWEIEYEDKPFAEVSKRHIRSHPIKEYKQGIIYVKGTVWEIPFEEIGNNYYLSKQACIAGAIRNNLKAALENYDDHEQVMMVCREIISLCKMLDKTESQ